LAPEFHKLTRQLKFSVIAYDNRVGPAPHPTTPKAISIIISNHTHCVTVVAADG
jgi:hypothetical protein